MGERSLTVGDVCAYLNVSNEVVYKWIERRAMLGPRVGRRGYSNRMRLMSGFA